jgi:hypothetical protein
MLANQAPGLGHAQSMQMTELAWGLLRDTEDRLARLIHHGRSRGLAGVA